VSTSRALWYNGNGDGAALEFQVAVVSAVTGLVTPLTEFSSATEVPGLLLPMSLADSNHVVTVTIVARNPAGCVMALGDSVQVLLSPPTLLTLAARFSSGVWPNSSDSTASSSQSGSSSSGTHRVSKRSFRAEV
jgi:hypothetical protein